MFTKRICLCLVAMAGLFGIARAQAHSHVADGREADRTAIRAQIESIFQALIDKDVKKLRAAHAEDWRGFLENSDAPLKGMDEYMKSVGGASASGMENLEGGLKSYKITSYDTRFEGRDVAIVSLVADVEYLGGKPGTLRILDVYARRGGRWIQAASHSAPHPRAIEKERSDPVSIAPELRERILRGREAVWRAWFGNDQAALEKLIPDDAIAIGSGPGAWENRTGILEGAKRFAASGTKLVRLEFPRTEIQMYGDTIVLYTTYVTEFEKDGQRATNSGRGTEIFVIRNGLLVNTGWHLDSVK